MSIIALAFLLLMSGVFILGFDILPIIGWVLIITAFFISVFSVLLKRSSKVIKIVVSSIMLVAIVIALIILLKSLGQITLDGHKTVSEIGKILGHVIKVIKK